MTIYKYALDPGIVEMPAGAKLLHIGKQNDALFAWAFVDPQAAMTPTLRVIGMGHPVPDYDELGALGGTYLLHNDRLVVHVFALAEPKLTAGDITRLAPYHIGIYFGFPTCCITWFIEHRLGGPQGATFKLTSQQEAIHNKNGFLPCPSCAEKVTAETIHTLIKNRVCSLPYPEDFQNPAIKIEMSCYLRNIRNLIY